MILGQEQLFLEQINSASQRFDDQIGKYRFKQGQLQGGSVLQMDSKPRLTDWLIRTTRMNAAPVTSLDALVEERFIGGNDLLGVQFFQLGVARSSAVGRVVIRNAGGATRGYGTGVLIAPGVILTNNHVLPSAAVAAPGLIKFNYQIGPTGQQLLPVGFALRPDILFHTNKDLDFSLCAVAARSENNDALSDFGFVKIIEETGKIVEGNAVNIIQHPSGAVKQVAIRANKLIHILDSFLHYETDTAPGSSGSPVFSDQWELVGLHHAGVPRKNTDGKILVKGTGAIWTPDMGDEQIDWIANEGIRASVIAKDIKNVPGLSEDQKRLRNSIFEAALDSAPPPPRPIGSANMPRVGKDGTITWSFPIEFSIRVPGLDLLSTPPEPPAAPAVPAPVISNKKRAEVDQLRKRVDKAFAEAAPKKYFDQAADTAAATAYYANIAANLTAKKRYDALHKLLKSTHTRPLAYKPAVYLYPWVDIQPGAGDPKVRSIYSGQLFPAKDFANEDLQIEMDRLEMAERLVREASLSEDVVFNSDVLEGAAPYNCEHVVPQSWFQKRSPMRGDLHHLFSCEQDCNSFRGNTPYFDFPDTEEVIRKDCGQREEERFEPGNGKGEVARATLYFLLRYPGQISTARFPAERLPILLAWHNGNKITDHERHRNAAIFEAQGNRNPLIDHPEWADKIDFTLGFTAATDETFQVTDQELFAQMLAGV